MWNSLPLPFVCEIHTLKRCLYYNHLPHNPISAARRQKITTKKEALALTESKQSRSLCWWLWQVHSLAEEWGKIKTLRAVAKIVAEVIFPSTPRSTCWEMCPLLLPKQKPLSQWTIGVAQLNLVAMPTHCEPWLDRKLWWWSEQPPQNIW